MRCFFLLSLSVLLLLTDGNASASNNALDKRRAANICKIALNMDGEWDRTSYFYIEKVEEAKRLGLSERDCARILNRFSKANVFGPKVDGKSLIIRVQTALKKLGLYKGVLDGNLNSDTRTASKNWQLDNGYWGNGVITQFQLGELEKNVFKVYAAKNTEKKKQTQDDYKQIPNKVAGIRKSAGTGSGFFVSKLGHIVTNEHVVRNCGSITVGDSTTSQVGATLVEKDKRNDLALLRISSTQMASAESKSLISKLGLRVEISTPSVPLASGGLLRPDDVELGEDLLVSGYPYGDIFSNTIKVTKGIVSANKGMGDDSSQFQMDAAVQAGNSGGPIYDENGNIVGVVVQQLNKLKVAKVMGSLPENVNFGIKASTVRQFLTAAGLPTKWSNRSKRRSTKDLAKIAKNQTVMVVCNP